jgi:Holliday junction resolvase
MKDESEETEKDVEQSLCKMIKKYGGTAYKFTSPARRSVPDRLCIMPKDKHFFVEVKRPGKTRTKLQKIECKRLTDLDHKVYVVHSRREVNQLQLFLFYK